MLIEYCIELGNARCTINEMGSLAAEGGPAEAGSASPRSYAKHSDVTPHALLRLNEVRRI